MSLTHRRTLTNLCVAGLLAACATPPPPPAPPPPAPVVARQVKSYVVLLASPDGSTGKVIVRGDKGEQVIDQANAGVPLDGSTPQAPVAADKIRQDFASTIAARPLLPERFLLYFESAGVGLTRESQALLPRILESVAKRPGVDVSIIGHTDTAGRAEVNDELAKRRAEAVARLIRDQGLRSDVALTVESHGERNLLIQTADEVSEARNRRVEISIR